MFLILLLKIVFCFLIVSYSIRWVSWHINNWNKKARVFHGNTRMPFDVEFALMYGIHAKRKKRLKDLSYRKTLAEWMQMLDAIYPPDNLNFTHPPHSNLVTPKSPEGDFSSECFTTGSQKLFPELKNKNPISINNTPTIEAYTDLKSPSGDLGVKTENNNFTKIKKEFNAFTAKPCAKNNSLVSSLLSTTKIVSINNLKISQNTIPFPKQILACTGQIFTV